MTPGLRFNTSGSTAATAAPGECVFFTLTQCYHSVSACGLRLKAVCVRHGQTRTK